MKSVAIALCFLFAAPALAQQPQPQPEYTLTVTVPDLQVIEAGLNELPAKHAIPIMRKLQQQIAAQDEARKKKPEPEADPK